MKRILLLVLAFTAAIGSLSAQNYIVVNSEKVFKSIDEYNKALDTLDQLAKSYQQQVDLKFEEVEALYNNYKAQEIVPFGFVTTGPAKPDSHRERGGQQITRRRSSARTVPL